MKPVRASGALYVETLVVVILSFVFFMGLFLYDFLRAWYLFIASYLVSRTVIWFVADVLKIRLMLPLLKAEDRRMSLYAQNVDSKAQADPQQDSKVDYSKMNYQQLRGVLDSNESSSMSDDRFRLLESAFTYRAQNKLHVHHFMLGIPLMPFTWALYFYDTTLGSSHLGMIVAGFTFALFMSEFWHLLTQKWGR